jgi:hypothetical protein
MHRETMESYLVTTWLLEYQRLSSRFKPFTPLILRCRLSGKAGELQGATTLAPQACARVLMDPGD